MPNLLDLPYTIVDLETTGANAHSDRITEIGLLSCEVGHPPESWEQLINPGTGIPEFIVQLTGITPAMVADQPYFDEVAESLFSKLEKNLFIAHNARFDYGFLKAAFKACGITFKPKVICTVKLARALFPEWRSHSLDNICREIGYPRDISHRAMADVQAVYVFLCYATAHRGEEAVNKACRKQLKQPSLPRHIDSEQIENLPEKPGVYYFYGEDKQLLYVGKSTALKTRVKSHFGADIRSQKEMKLSQSIRDIRYRKTAGDLSAQLLENSEIKSLSPVYNQRQRGYKALWFIALSQGDDGFLLPHIESVPTSDWQSKDHLFGPFKNKSTAKKALTNLIHEHQLCLQVLGLEGGEGACFARQINQCRGACEGSETAALHNVRLTLALNDKKLKTWPYQGAVIVEEADTVNGLHCYHVVDQWCLLGTFTEYEDGLEALNTAPIFDIDTYRILVRALTSGNCHIREIEKPFTNSTDINPEQ